MKEISYVGLNEKVYVHEHKSGLKTYMWVNEKIKSCLMSLTVPYGSIHTEFKVKNKKYKVPNGLAHFLEHVKFNESDDFSAHDFFYKSNGDANAFTTFKYTSYILYTTSKLKENLNHVLDYIYNPYFTKKIVQKEKGIIIEEANMTNDDPYTLALFIHLKNMFYNSNYRNIITGEPVDIKEISVEDLFAVYNAFYHPSNMFLCLMGNFNPYEMAKVIDDNLDQKEFGKFVEPEIIKVKEPKEVVKKYEEVNLNVTFPKIRYGVKIPRQKFKNFDDWHLNVILRLMLSMNFGVTSEFHDELINSGLVTDIYATSQIIDDYVTIFVNADTNYPKEVLKKIEEKLANLELDPKAIERKKKANIASLILDFDDIEAVNNRFINDLIFYNELILDNKERIKNLNYDMFKELQDNIDLKNSSVLVINSLKEEN